MQRAISLFTPIRLWQALTLIAALVGSGLGAFTLTGGFDSPAAAALTENQQLIPVSRGDLVDAVDINGSVLFPNRERVGFEIGGTVGEVFVEEGGRVRAGEPLAALDAATLAELEEAAANARVALDDARARLDPPTEVEVAEAEAAVVNARAGLDDAREAVDDVRNPFTDLQLLTQRQAIAQAKNDLHAAEEALADAEAVAGDDELAVLTQRQAVVQASVDLQHAEEALADAQAVAGDDGLAVAAQRQAVVQAEVDLQNAEEALADAAPSLDLQQIVKQEEAVAAARVKLADAQEALAGAQEPPTAAAIDAAQAKIEAAKAARDDAVQALVDAQEDQPGIIEAAEDAFEAARNVYNQALVDSEIVIAHPSTGELLDPRTQVPLGDGDFLLDPEVLRDRIAPGATVSDEAFDAWAALMDAGDAIEAAEAGQEITDARRDLTRKEQDLADAEEALATLTAPPDPLGVALKQAGVATAEEDLAQAEQTLADLLNETADPLDLDLKRARVATAEAKLADEVAKLADMLGETADPLDLDLKQARVATAEAKLADEVAKLADMLGESADPLDLELKQARVATAAAKLADEEAQLADMLAPPDALLTAQGEADVSVAEAKLGDAEDALADLLDGLDPLVRALRQREIATAEADLASAEQDLARTIIAAPIGGIVETVNVEAGDEVTPTGFAVEIVDTSVAEIDGAVDEIDVLFLNVGAEAAVTMDALLGQTLAGVVSSIETTGGTQGGVVSFPVRVRVDAPPGVDLREGLSAAASVVLRETRDALLVPSAAIGGSFLQPTVLVHRDGKITEQPVDLGDGDDFNVVVLDGLNEGDTVVVETAGGDLGIFGALFGGGQGLRQIFGAGGRPPGTGGQDR